MEIVGNLHIRQSLKNTDQMKLGTEKNVSCETDNLMENCDSLRVNNITRKRLRNIDLMPHFRERKPGTCIIPALFPRPGTAQLLAPPKNRHALPREVFARV